MNINLIIQLSESFVSTIPPYAWYGITCNICILTLPKIISSIANMIKVIK